VFPKTPRVGVVTISGGVGVQMADAAAELDLELPRMPDAAQQKILAMVPFAGPANPVDATAQVINDWSMFTTILGIVADEGNVDSVISFLAHTGTSPGVSTTHRMPTFSAVRPIDRTYQAVASSSVGTTTASVGVTGSRVSAGVGDCAEHAAVNATARTTTQRFTRLA